VRSFNAGGRTKATLTAQTTRRRFESVMFDRLLVDRRKCDRSAPKATVKETVAFSRFPSVF
jgi:hypothetical protein